MASSSANYSSIYGYVRFKGLLLSMDWSWLWRLIRPHRGNHEIADIIQPSEEVQCRIISQMFSKHSKGQLTMVMIEIAYELCQDIHVDMCIFVQVITTQYYLGGTGLN